MQTIARREKTVQQAMDEVVSPLQPELDKAQGTSKISQYTGGWCTSSQVIFLWRKTPMTNVDLSVRQEKAVTSRQREWKKTLLGLAFISPWLLGFFWLPLSSGGVFVLWVYRVRHPDCSQMGWVR